MKDKCCGNCVYADDGVCEFAGEISTYYVCDKYIKRINVIESLYTFLSWLQSVDCKEEWFDKVSKYGHLDASLDEVIHEAIIRLTIAEDNGCQHDFVDADNEAPYGDLVCRFCGYRQHK